MTERKQTEGKRHRLDKEEKRQRRRDRGEETEGKRQRCESEGKRHRGRDIGEERGRERGGREG